MRNVLIAMFVCLAASAQQGENVMYKRQGDVLMMAPQAVELQTGTITGKISPEGFQYVSTMMHFENKVVKNAPYSADAVTETIQTLPDGNRITRKNTSTVYRDSQGRTRRETTIEAIGPFAASGQPAQIISISDPAAQVSWVLEPSQKIARKSGFNMPGPGLSIGGMVGERRELRVVTRQPGGEPVEITSVGDAKPAMQPTASKTESLGTRNIEGVPADGTRSTTTIPAGEIGNERPIDIVSERWYSPELQTVVMSKRVDPRFGETNYKLTRINRSEPPATLFQPPADYTVKEGPQVFIHKQAEK